MNAAALILVADDSPLIRAMLRDRLVRQGYRVAEAADGEQALVTFRALRPDVILLDVEMPVLDGYGVLTAIKVDPLLADTPVVFLTVRAEAEDVVRGLQMGAHDYLRKPFDGSELLARVSAALRVKRLQDELRRRNEELDRSARVDVLTGVYNRRQLDQELHRLFAETKRRGGSMGALMIDVDLFKTVNDRFGHAVGDQVLRAVASRLQAAVRADDIFGRWGGEEFLVLVRFSSREQLAALAERARSSVAISPVAIEIDAEASEKAVADRIAALGKGIGSTVSIGAALSLGGTPDELVRRADAAMYEAKHAGRNCVVVAPDVGGDDGLASGSQ